MVGTSRLGGFGLVCLAAFAGCGGEAPAPTDTAPTPTSAAPAPAPASQTHPSVATFHGSVDVARGTMTIAYDSDALQPMAALPPTGTFPKVGEGASGVIAHTVPGTVFYGGTCGTGNLCGSVEAENNFTVAGYFYFYIDSYSTTGITANGPWGYANVGASSTSGALTWSFSDPGGTSFSFVGHVEAGFASCDALLTALPSTTTGTYEIDPGGTQVQTNCLVASGVGWTQLLDDNATVGTGIETAATWGATLSTTNANSGLYSIYSLLGSIHTGTNYTFYNVYQSSGAQLATEQWTQTQNPSTLSNAVPTLVGSPVLNPTTQLSQCGSPEAGFVGLYKTNRPAFLSGDGDVTQTPSSPCYWFSIGMTSLYNSGIPAYASNSTTTFVASRQTLYVK